MDQLRILALPLASFASVALAGCGLISQDFSGQLEVPITIDSMESTYSGVEYLNINDVNPELRDHRDKIAEGSEKVREIRIEIAQRLDKNLATLGWGQVFIRKSSEDAWPEEPLENAIAVFDGVPIEDGQNFKLVVPPHRRKLLGDVLFREPEIDVRVRVGADSGPVHFKAKIILSIEFTAGI